MQLSTEKMLSEIRSRVPEALRSAWRVETDGYPCGSLSHARISVFSESYGRRYLKLSTLDLKSLLETLPHLADASLDGVSLRAYKDGWVWEDRSFEGLPHSVHMATRCFSILITPSKDTSPVSDWRGVSGIDEILNSYCYGDDPRIAVPGHNWLDYVQKQLGAKFETNGSYCECRPYGYDFEVYTAGHADFVEQAYGAVLGLPACSISRAEKGSRKERSYQLQIRIPGAIPARSFAGIATA